MLRFTVLPRTSVSSEKHPRYRSDDGRPSRCVFYSTIFAICFLPRLMLPRTFVGGSTALTPCRLRGSCIYHVPRLGPSPLYRPFHGVFFLASSWPDAVSAVVDQFRTSSVTGCGPLRFYALVVLPLRTVPCALFRGWGVLRSDCSGPEGCGSWKRRLTSVPMLPLDRFSSPV